MSDKNLHDLNCPSCGRQVVSKYPETKLCYLCAMTNLYYEGSKFDDE